MISQRHEKAGYTSPTKTALVKGVWDGLQRKIGIKEEGKEALWLDELRQVIQKIPQDQMIWYSKPGIINQRMGWSLKAM